MHNCSIKSSFSFLPTANSCARNYVSVSLCADVPPPSSPSSPTPTHRTTPPVPPTAESLSAGALAAIIIILVVAALGVFAGVFLGCYFMKRHQKKQLIQLRREATLKRSVTVLCQSEVCHSLGASC